MGPVLKVKGIKNFSKLDKIKLKLGPKVTCPKLVALMPSVLKQYFKDSGPKITYLNKNLGTLKPSKVWNCVIVLKLNGIKDFPNWAKLP